ncbi:hypothetical protein AVEN_254364-1 [Araneus ventricosus]|uniref:Uncharacterized protein n=1 Tax=Araneus ventricosus TaxID=182803 RepID=A0A4Y2KI30_ARAVE|nr:hypothetical protein AVEN_254364-1 [Araneus ventricosus]
MRRGNQENRHFCSEEYLAGEYCDIEESETVPVEPMVNEVVSLAKIGGLEVDSNDIHELEEEYNQRAYGVALCFTARSYGGEFVRGRGNSKATIF